MELSRLQAITRTRLLRFFYQDLKTGEKIPSELSLSQQLGVSRTVIKKVISKLQHEGVLDDEKKIIHLNTINNEKEVNPIVETGEVQFRNFFFKQVQNGFILPGSKLSVLELAELSGCNRTIVREFLYQFSRYGLIEKLPRKKWGMVEIDNSYIEDLLTARENLEKTAIRKLLRKGEPLLGLQFKTLSDQINSLETVKFTPDLFQKIEAEFLNQLMLIEKNRFVSEFYNHLHFISGFLFQWIPIEEFDQIDFRHTFLVQLIGAIESFQLEDSLVLVTEFYQTLRVQLEDSLQLLLFP
jgi:DNA-binding GntR family transcriptional regulator